MEEEEDEQQSGPSGVQNVRVIGVERLDKYDGCVKCYAKGQCK